MIAPLPRFVKPCAPSPRLTASASIPPVGGRFNDKILENSSPFLTAPDATSKMAVEDPPTGLWLHAAAGAAHTLNLNAWGRPLTITTAHGGICRYKAKRPAQARTR